MRTLDEEAQAQGFDLKVQHRDKRTGQVTHVNPYKLRIIGKDRTKLFERPVGSGNLYNAQGKEVGRWLVETTKDGETIEKYDPKAKHVAYTAPLTQDQKLAQEANKVFAENEALKRELEAMKKETEKLAKSGKTEPEKTKGA